MGEVTAEFNFFFYFEGMLYWYEMKAYIFKNLFLSYFFNISIKFLGNFIQNLNKGFLNFSSILYTIFAWLLTL